MVSSASAQNAVTNQNLCHGLMSSAASAQNVNPVYNLLPDILSSLGAEADLPPEQFQARILDLPLADFLSLFGCIKQCSLLRPQDAIYIKTR